MPVRIIGMIGVTPPADEATVHIITGGVSPEYLVQFARAHEASDFDLVLVGYTSQSAEGFAVAAHAAAWRHDRSLPSTRCGAVDWPSTSLQA